MWREPGAILRVAELSRGGCGSLLGAWDLAPAGPEGSRATEVPRGRDGRAWERPRYPASFRSTQGPQRPPQDGGAPPAAPAASRDPPPEAVRQSEWLEGAGQSLAGSAQGRGEAGRGPMGGPGGVARAKVTGCGGQRRERRRRRAVSAGRGDPVPPRGTGTRGRGVLPHGSPHGDRGTESCPMAAPVETRDTGSCPMAVPVGTGDTEPCPMAAAVGTGETGPLCREGTLPHGSLYRAGSVGVVPPELRPAPWQRLRGCAHRGSCPWRVSCPTANPAALLSRVVLPALRRDGRGCLCGVLPLGGASSCGDRGWLRGHPHPAAPHGSPPGVLLPGV